MISGVCHCGHTAPTIMTVRDVLALASGHGHFPEDVKLTCGCGASFEMGPIKPEDYPAGADSIERLEFALKDAAVKWRELRSFISDHKDHKNYVM